MRNSRKGLLALGLLAAVSTAAIAAGNYETYPIVGYGSFCASNNPNGTGVTGATGQQGTANCVQTVPAGPATLTGSEVQPADTEIGSGTNPQTVTVPMPLSASGAYYYDNLGTTLPAAQVIPNNINTFLVDATTTITSLTLTMPSAPLNGQIVRIASTQTATNLLIQGAAGQTVSNAPTVLTKSTTGAYNYAFIWVPTTLGTNQWLRLQ